MRNVSAIFGALDHSSVPLDETAELLDQSTKLFRRYSSSFPYIVISRQESISSLIIFIFDDDEDI